MKVTNCKVYGLQNSLKVGGYAMVSDTENWEFHGVQRVKSATKLSQAKQGSGHDSLLKGIVVQMDFTNSLASEKEFQRYHWWDFVTSTSTMHRLAEMNISLACNAYVDRTIKDRLECLIRRYKSDVATYGKGHVLTKDSELRMLYNIPTGFELTAGMTTNYMQLKTMYAQRLNHRLPDWWGFKKWVESLPMSHLITKETVDEDIDWNDLKDYYEVEDYVFEDYSQEVCNRYLNNEEES